MMESSKCNGCKSQLVTLLYHLYFGDYFVNADHFRSQVSTAPFYSTKHDILCEHYHFKMNMQHI